MSISWYWTLPSPKPYMLTFPHCHFGAVSQSYLRSCLLGCSPHFSPNKTKLATLMLCFFFFLSQDFFTCWFLIFKMLTILDSWKPFLQYTVSVSRSVMPDSLRPHGLQPSVHEIFQARILEWVAISFSRGSSQPRNQTWVSCTAGRFFTNWTTVSNNT